MRLASSPTLLALCVAVGAVGCGDLSQEDLLFRAAVPPRDAVALTVPGASTESASALTARQALGGCADGDLRCDATEVATAFNGLTFFLLDVVDAVVALPPTLREPGRRVWGPHFDIQKNQTFRFEMVRDDEGSTWAFCLHAARGRVTDRDIDNEAMTCASEDGSDDVGDLINVFSGAFEPSDIAGDGARQGRGVMRFEAEKVARFDGGDRFARILDFTFDNRDDEVHIDVDLSGAPVDNLDVERDAAYSFNREQDGSGDFEFEFFVDLVGSGDLIPRRTPEHVSMVARWQADLSGRALAIVDEGDVEPGVDVNIDQCWNSSLETIRFKDVDGNVSVGQEDTVCAFAAGEVDVAD